MGWPPPGWTIARPPLSELIPFFAGSPSGSPPGTTGLFQELMTILGGAPGAAQGILGTLSPIGTTTVGWRMNQINDIAALTQNAYATGLLATPGTPTLVASATGGFLLSETIYVVVTALDGIGETMKSAEANAAVTGPTGSVAVSGYTVSGASQYRIYAGTSTGGETGYFITTASTFTITVAGGPSFFLASPPSATTAAAWTADDSSKVALGIAYGPGADLRIVRAPAAAPLAWQALLHLDASGNIRPGAFFGGLAGSLGNPQAPGQAGAWGNGYFTGAVQGGSNTQVPVGPSFL